MTLCRSCGDVRNFTADAILFREIQRKKNDTLMFYQRFSAILVGIRWNMKEYRLHKVCFIAFKQLPRDLWNFNALQTWLCDPYSLTLRPKLLFYFVSSVVTGSTNLNNILSQSMSLHNGEYRTLIKNNNKNKSKCMYLCQVQFCICAFIKVILHVYIWVILWALNIKPSFKRPSWCNV